MLSFTEKIKVMLTRRGMTVGELASKTGQSRQNLSNKMARGNFSEKEMQAIADVLNCDYDPRLTMRDSGEFL